MKTQLNILVACESSGVVRDAFRALGHNAWSCDLLPCDADPQWHVQGDVFRMLQGNRVAAQLGPLKSPATWDLMIAHPPCTYMCNSGVCWLYRKDKSTATGWDVHGNLARWDNMLKGAEFFAKLYSANVPYIAVENPIMHGHAARHIANVLKLKQPRIKATQFVQPWQFGHGECKATGLHLRNLPKLVPTDIVDGREQRLHRLPPGPNRWKERSKTFEGIAKAMASQWSAHILAEKQKGTTLKQH